MSYKDYFPEWRSNQDTAEIKPYIYIRNPAMLSDSKDVAYYDGRAAQTIRELETIIANLKDYRQALTARYGELETMPYTRLLKLERRPGYDHKITYYLTVTKTYSDGSQVSELRETYPGKERKQAFDRFQALQKQFPGIPWEQDTAKRNWEK